MCSDSPGPFSRMNSMKSLKLTSSSGSLPIWKKAWNGALFYAKSFDEKIVPALLRISCCQLLKLVITRSLYTATNLTNGCRTNVNVRLLFTIWLISSLERQSGMLYIFLTSTHIFVSHCGQYGMCAIAIKYLFQTDNPVLGIGQYAI